MGVSKYSSFTNFLYINIAKKVQNAAKTLMIQQSLI